MSAMLLLSVLSGCGEFPPGGNTDPVTLESDTEVEVPTAQVTWSEDGVTITLQNTSGMNFTEFGIAQNDSRCLFDEDEGVSPGCWTGEDCLNGDLTSDESTSLSLCHAIGTRRTLTLEFIPDGIDMAVNDGDLQAVNGQYTAFPDASYENLVTYYLKEADGQCWRWGLDTSYYAGLGCNNAN